MDWPIKTLSAVKDELSMVIRNLALSPDNKTVEAARHIRFSLCQVENLIDATGRGMDCSEVMALRLSEILNSLILASHGLKNCARPLMAQTVTNDCAKPISALIEDLAISAKSSDLVYYPPHEP